MLQNVRGLLDLDVLRSADHLTREVAKRMHKRRIWLRSLVYKSMTARLLSAMHIYLPLRSLDPEPKKQPPPLNPPDSLYSADSDPVALCR